jgi:hypothetical protein
MYALLPITRHRQQQQQRIEQAKKHLINTFQTWVFQTIRQQISVDTALSILARLVRMTRKQGE